MTQLNQQISELEQQKSTAARTVAEALKQQEALDATLLAKAQEVQAKAWERVDGALDERDAKAFDAYTRGLAAMERMSASAAGENKPVPTQVAVINQTALSAEERDELLREFRASVALEVK